MCIAVKGCILQKLDIDLHQHKPRGKSDVFLKQKKKEIIMLRILHLVYACAAKLVARPKKTVVGSLMYMNLLHPL